MIILAVDDEKIALERLVRSIQEAEPASKVFAYRKAGEALAFFHTHRCDVAFLDIQIRETNGITLAKQMKLIYPQVNIVFATGHAAYMGQAFALHASGYLMKPITPEKIRIELDNLRYPVEKAGHKRVRFCTFGNFEVYIDKKTVKFKYDKTKELLAYLVDRNGAFTSNAEMMSALWDDKKHASYLGNLKKDLVDTLRQFGCSALIETGRNKIRVVPEVADCDYFDWYAGKPQAIAQYHGEYMAQYSWAELTNGDIYKEYIKHRQSLVEIMQDTVLYK